MDKTCFFGQNKENADKIVQSFALSNYILYRWAVIMWKDIHSVNKLHQCVNT